MSNLSARCLSVASLVLVVQAAALAALLAAPATAQQEDLPDDQAIPSVTVATAELREVRAVVPISGTVLPRNEVLVTPQVSGLQIREVYRDIGDWVTEGEVLIALRPDTLEAQLIQAEAETARAQSSISQAGNEIASTTATLAQIEADFERYRSLRDSGNVSDAQFEEVRANTAAARAAAATAQDGLAIATASRAQAEAQKKIAELNLSWTRIAAPVDGVIGSRSAKVGALTALSGEPLLTVIDGGTLEVSADVIETALGTIRPGNPSDVEVAGIGPLIGLVRLVPPTVDPVTRLGEVRITLEGHPNLRSGLFAGGVIETERREAVTVPITAVLSDGEGPFVQVVKDDVVARRAVEPGLVWQGQREILTGLEAGETVIARAGAFFRDGDKVRGLATAEGEAE